MARLARKRMADMRAVDEEVERVNPIGATGATPTMGLSTVRGGVKMLGRTRRAKSPESVSSMEELVGGGDMDRMVGSGKHSEAKLLGQKLSKHVKDLHGGAFWDEFKEGFDMVLAPVDKKKVGSGTMKGQMRKTARKAYEDTEEDMMEGGCGKSCAPMKGGIGTGAYEGKGKLLLKHLPHGEGEEIEMSGGAKKGSARAAIVRKVMKDKGMSMIEASSYVKQHGLYKK
jgi:hypothetical protein